jgi:hypothetical protein
VTEEYFEAMSMPIAAGRSLQATDMRPTSPRAVVINERLAEALWPGENAVGKRLSTWAGPDDPEWREVVGVAGDVRSFGQNSPVPMELFVPYTQAPAGAWQAFGRSMALVLQSAEGWPITFVPLLRRAAAGVDASLPLYDVRTMEDIVVSATAHRRFYLRLVLLLATTGLGLAILGIYGGGDGPAAGAGRTARNDRSPGGRTWLTADGDRNCARPSSRPRSDATDAGLALRSRPL